MVIMGSSRVSSKRKVLGKLDCSGFIRETIVALEKQSMYMDADMGGGGKVG